MSSYYFALAKPEIDTQEIENVQSLTNRGLYCIPIKRVIIIFATAADEENENSKHKSKNPRNILTFFNEFAEGT